MPVVLCPREDPLLAAALNGHSAKIKEELDKGKSVDSRDLEHGRTVLTWAAECGHEDAVQLLLDYKANVNASDLRGRTPLLQAAANGHIGLVRRLLAAGARVDCRDVAGQTALILAAKYGSETVVACLLDKGADPDVQEWRDGRTALSWAAELGYEKTVEVLLDGNAAVDLEDNRRRTPMSWAARNGHVGVVTLCLRWKASTETKDMDYDRTPFLWAIKQGHEPVIEILKGVSPPEINYGLALHPAPTPSARLEELQEVYRTIKPDFDWRKNQGGELLIWALESDREEDVEFLIQQGADVNAQDDDKMNVLSIASQKGLLDLVKVLLQRDVNLNHVDRFGRTPLSWAAEGGHTEVVRLLTARNANLELGDETQMRPIHWAAALGHESIVSLFLDQGAELNCEDENLRTPLSYAAENGQESLVSLLLGRGALPDEGAEESPLMYAVSEDNLALVELLLGKGADPYSDSYGCAELPPLVLAASHGKENMVKLFLDRSAVSDEVKKDHVWRALVVACEEGEYDVVRLLLAQRPFEGMEGDDLDSAPLWFAEVGRHYEVVDLLRPYYPGYESG